MTSLSEVYVGDSRSGARRPPQRVYAGAALFLVGSVLVVAGILVATTDVLYTTATTQGVTDSRHVGGLLGGLGVPAVLLGISTVLPANKRTRAAAVVGASVAVLGVGLFWHAYPCQWSGSNCGAGLMDLTLSTVGVYFLGTITTVWCLFVGVATFKTRNDPGGTVTMEVTRQGETKVVEVERSSLSSMGFFGTNSDGSSMPTGTVSDGGDRTRTVRTVESTETGTQTQAQTPSTPPQAKSGAETGGPPTRSASGDGTDVDSWSTSMLSPSSGPVSDGGSASADITSPLDDGTEFVPNPGERSSQVGDAYCGNCTHFEYVRTDEGIQPYCGLHDDMMADMDACDQWDGGR